MYITDVICVISKDFAVVVEIDPKRISQSSSNNLPMLAVTIGANEITLRKLFFFCDVIANCWRGSVNDIVCNYSPLPTDAEETVSNVAKSDDMDVVVGGSSTALLEGMETSARAPWHDPCQPVWVNTSGSRACQ